LVDFHLGSITLDEGAAAAEWTSGGVRSGASKLSISMKAGFVGDRRCSPSLVSIHTTRDIEGRKAAAACVHRRPIIIALIPSSDE